MRKLSPLCFITPNSCDPALLEKTVRSVLEAGVRWVQYRDKDRDAKELYTMALRLRELTNQFEACLIVNDRADIALAAEADGVHLGQDDLPLKEARRIMGDGIIGLSTHNIAEAVEAEKNGADYIGFGSIFPTGTKNGVTLQGVEAIREIKSAVKIPVIAIGGITVENAARVFEAGADGIAVSSGLSNGDLTQKVAALNALGKTSCR